MKKISLVFIVGLVILFSGCASKTMILDKKDKKEIFEQANYYRYSKKPKIVKYKTTVFLNCDEIRNKFGSNQYYGFVDYLKEYRPSIKIVDKDSSYKIVIKRFWDGVYLSVNNDVKDIPCCKNRYRSKLKDFFESDAHYNYKLGAWFARTLLYDLDWHVKSTKEYQKYYFDMYAKQDTIEAYQKFLKIYYNWFGRNKKYKYIRKAEKRVKQLEEEQLYKLAVEQNTEEAYQNFLEKYPNSTYTQKVQKKKKDAKIDDFLLQLGDF